MWFKPIYKSITHKHTGVKKCRTLSKLSKFVCVCVCVFYIWRNLVWFDLKINVKVVNAIALMQIIESFVQDKFIFSSRKSHEHTSNRIGTTNWNFGRNNIQTYRKRVSVTYGLTRRSSKQIIDKPSLNWSLTTNFSFCIDNKQKKTTTNQKERKDIKREHLLISCVRT